MYMICVVILCWHNKLSRFFSKYKHVKSKEKADNLFFSHAVPCLFHFSSDGLVHASAHDKMIWQNRPLLYMVCGGVGRGIII